MKAYNFAVKQQGSNVHHTIFKAIKKNDVQEFNREKGGTEPILFFANGKFIVARTRICPENIISIEETFDVQENEKVCGKVTLTPYKQCAFTAEQYSEFKEKHGRQPSYVESHPYRLLEGDEWDQYIRKLLTKAGLKDIQCAHEVDGYRFLAKARKSFIAYEVDFCAVVSDLSAFERAWYHGIGRYKTYGFGMLRVSKP